jgi:hypothetical protein
VLALLLVLVLARLHWSKTQPSAPSDRTSVHIHR